MIGRRNLLMGVWIGIVLIALATVGAGAAEPSAKSFVEAIYANYKGKNAKGVALANDAAVKRYFEPKLAALIVKDRNRRPSAATSERSTAIPSSMPRISRSTPSMSRSAIPQPTRRARPSRSRT